MKVFKAQVEVLAGKVRYNYTVMPVTSKEKAIDIICEIYKVPKSTVFVVKLEPYTDR